MPEQNAAPMSDNAAPILSRADTVNLILTLRWRGGENDTREEISIRIARNDQLLREDIQRLTESRDAISALFPDDAPHKHHETGVSLLDDVRDLIADLFTAENHRVALMTMLGVQGGSIYDATLVINGKIDEVARLTKERDAAQQTVNVTIGTSVLTKDLVWCGGCKRGLFRIGNWHHCPQCGRKIDQESYRKACAEAESNGGDIARYISGEGADRIKALEEERDEARISGATALESAWSELSALRVELAQVQSDLRMAKAQSSKDEGLIEAQDKAIADLSVRLEALSRRKTVKHNQPKVEQVEMNEIATKASRVAEYRTVCLIDESLRIARANNQDPFRTVAVSAYLQGVKDALTPPAELSGNTGELPVCATCNGVGMIGGFVNAESGYHSEPCPDCSAAQPARASLIPGPIDPPVPPRDRAVESNPFPQIHCECGTVWSQEVNTVCPNCYLWPVREPEQPRIWRVRKVQSGVTYHTGTLSETEARHWQRMSAGSSLVYSTDNGETWIDEQAEREGK